MATPVQHAAEAWGRYVATGALSHQLLREPTYRAWERSHSQGANPRQAKAESLSAIDAARLLEARHDFIATARPYLKSLARAAGNERHAAMLGDNQAVLLEVIGDEATIHGPDAFPKAGDLLSEAVSGANGIGSTLAEGQYVELVGPEHFISGFHQFTCQGMPILEPSGETIGIISTSVRRPEASQRVREILLAGARGIEAELWRLRLGRVVSEALVAEPGNDMPLENLRQDIIQAQAAARLKVEAASRFVGGERLGSVAGLLAHAQTLMETFKAQAALWLELAVPATGILQPVDLHERLHSLAELLETEAATRQIRLVLGTIAPVRVAANPQQLTRQLLRRFLAAFEQAGRGGQVFVEAGRSETGKVAEISIAPVPQVRHVSHLPTPEQIRLPLWGGPIHD